MITGFNTDIEHGGVVYHVQTEDKGLETPLILSLIYTGGQILASKRTTYNDLVIAGFNETELSERLNRQHKILCAAIKSGRVEDLIRLSQRENERRTGENQPPPSETATPVPLLLLPDDSITLLTIDATVPVPPVIVPTLLPEPDFSDLKPQPQLAAKPSFGPAAFLFLDPVPVDTIILSLRKEQPLQAGTTISLDVAVCEGKHADAPRLPSVVVTLKIMGTSFRQLALSATTNAHGWANFVFELPEFKAGRAALVMRAESNGRVAELRRIVQPASGNQ